MIEAALAEQPVRDNAVRVELVEYWVRILLCKRHAAPRDRTITSHNKKESSKIANQFPRIQCNAQNTHLAQTRRKDDDFINLTHLLEKVVDTGALEHMEVVPMVLDLDRHDKVCLCHSLTKEVMTYAVSQTGIRGIELVP